MYPNISFSTAQQYNSINSSITSMILWYYDTSYHNTIVLILLTVHTNQSKAATPLRIGAVVFKEFSAFPLFMYLLFPLFYTVLLLLILLSVLYFLLWAFPAPWGDMATPETRQQDIVLPCASNEKKVPNTPTVIPSGQYLVPAVRSPLCTTVTINSCDSSSRLQWRAECSERVRSLVQKSQTISNKNKTHSNSI